MKNIHFLPDRELKNLCIPTLSLEITRILLQDRQFSKTFLNVKMTDLKNLIKVRFPDDGVSVIVHAEIVFFPFLLFLFLFLVDVGRSPSDHPNKCDKHGVAEVSA